MPPYQLFNLACAFLLLALQAPKATAQIKPSDAVFESLQVSKIEQAEGAYIIHTRDAAAKWVEVSHLALDTGKAILSYSFKLHTGKTGRYSYDTDARQIRIEQADNSKDLGAKSGTYTTYAITKDHTFTDTDQLLFGLNLFLPALADTRLPVGFPAILATNNIRRAVRAGLSAERCSDATFHFADTQCAQRNQKLDYYSGDTRPHPASPGVYYGTVSWSCK